MPTGDPTDVTSTLTDLERKLVELERELSTVAIGGRAGTDPPALPAVPAPTPTETRDASLRVEDLRGEISDLVKFRDQLESAARELVSEYDRLVARLQGVPAHPAPAPPEAAATPSHMAAPPSHVAAPSIGTPAPPPPAAGEIGADTVFTGAVVVDAGPFLDITTLQSFEQALSRVEGAQDVYVQSFEGNRALIDISLSNPVPLVQLLRNHLAVPIIAREAGEGRLTVDFTAADSHGT